MNGLHLSSYFQVFQSTNTNGITVTSMRHCFLVILQDLGTYLSFRFFWCAGMPKSIIRLAILFWGVGGGLSLGLVVWSRLGFYPFLSKNPREVRASHSPGWILGCEYTTCLCGQISIFEQLPVDYFPTPSCLVPYSFCANLQHSLIIWLIVSSLSPNNLCLPLCWVCYIFGWTLSF